MKTIPAQAIDGGTKPRRTIDTRMTPTRMIPLVRVLLGAATFLVVLLSNSIADRSPGLTEGLLLGYLAYGSVVYFLARIHSPLGRKMGRWDHWLDAGVFCALAVLDRQRGGFFYCGLLFSFIGASFRGGPASGLLATVASTAVISASMLAIQMRAHRPDFELLLAPPLTLLVLGGIIARWGGFQITLKRRLEFISGVTRVSNPRLGAAHMISSLLEKLSAFYAADACFLVTADLVEPGIRLWRVDGRETDKGERALPIPQDVVSLLLSLPPELAVVRRHRSVLVRLSRAWHFEYDILHAARNTRAEDAAEKLAATLDAASLLTVPLRYRNETVGRVFVTSARRCFEEADVFFLFQVFEHFMTVIDNIRLVDRMAEDAAVAERKRIARDLHDSVIQPYIGLKMGIGSLRHKFEVGTLQLGDIDHLIAINDEAVADLRRYISVLRGQAEENEDFIPAVKRFAAKFSFATGISVEVEADTELRILTRLATEALQIVAEGLSNIRRHTDSMNARVCIGCTDGRLILRIIDIGSKGVRPEPFFPRSIAERAEALGGTARVELSSQGGSTVVVDLPLL